MVRSSNGLTLHAVDFLYDYLGLSDLKLVALATHGLDEHRQVEHASAVDGPNILLGAFLNAEGEVAVELGGETVADVARSDVLAVAAEEGAVVDGEGHRHGGLVDGYTGQRFGIFGSGHGVADFEAFDSDKSADVAVADRSHFLASHTLEGVELLNFLADDRTVATAERNFLPFADLTSMHAADGNTADILGVVERRDEHLRIAGIVLGAGDIFYDGIEQGHDAVGGIVVVCTHPTLLGRAVECGEIELVLAGVEAEHEVEHHLLHFFGATVGLVDLVYHHHGLEADFDGLLKHEARLGHGPSKASTRSRQPSAMLSTRSTSPPKSACPGVSMMLIL